jgi:hydroxymethylglutaryl-CoA lyase
LSSIEITDVTLRDGLQAEAANVPTEKKVELFQKLLRCGYQRLEITSFAHPKWIPQLADSEAFCNRALSSPSPIELMAFVPNEKGLERLLAHPIPWVSAFVAASEDFNQKNVNSPISETLKSLKNITEQAHRERRKVRIYISTVFGCPYQGNISDSELEKVIGEVASFSPDEIALSDTIGVGQPSRVKTVLALSRKYFSTEMTALHLHNTYGLAIANTWEGYQAGVRKFDGSTGGIGGCPYAKGASGNCATEELLYLFHREKALMKLNAEPIAETLKFLKEMLGLTLRSKISEILDKGGTLHGLN